MHKVKLIYNHLGKCKKTIIFLIIATILYAGINLVPNLIISFLIDNVITGLEITNPFSRLLNNILGGTQYLKDNIWIIALTLVIVYLVVALFMNYRQNKQGVIAQTLTENIRNHLYSHIQLLPHAYLVRVKTGELIQKCTSDVDMIRRFFSGQFAEIFYILSTAMIALVIVFNINPKLSIYVLVSLIIIFIYSYFFFNQIQKQFKIADEQEAVLSTVIQESLSGVRVVKAFNRELYEIDKFSVENEKYKSLSSKLINYLGVYWSSSYVICLLGILFVVIAGIFEVRNNALTIGNFTVFITYQTIVLYSMRQLGRILTDFGKVSVSVGRIDEILNEEIEDIESGLRPSLNGDIVFDHISFSYDDDKQVVLKDINLTIKKNQTVAIIGPTGSGKSTLISLLSRLYEPDEGDIYINGINIKDISKEYLRNNVGVVLQEPFLYSRTIMSNLKMVNHSLNEEEIFDATRIASIHEVVSEFDKGYDTLVGEKGVTLSGGQKQRLAIARTILKNSPILVFDDSLSAVDTETDAKIRKAIHSLKGDITTIIITQRVSSAKDCDQIIVIEDGTITQIGNHQTLVNQDGLYKRINEIQSQIVLEEEVK